MSSPRRDPRLPSVPRGLVKSLRVLEIESQSRCDGRPLRRIRRRPVCLPDPRRDIRSAGVKTPAAMHALVMLALPLVLQAASIELSGPVEFQVVQRITRGVGEIRLRGTLSGVDAGRASLEVRIGEDGAPGEWRRLDAKIAGDGFEATAAVPVGGWYRVGVRVRSGGEAVAESFVEHVGVGEVFVVAGQSNAANHGEEKQATKTGRVATFDGKSWRLANDPQPGASGGRGSFLPPFGDAMAERLGVPVGFVACGIGATSVREWLPRGATFPNPPTIENRVAKRKDGLWESRGAAFDMFVERMQQFGPRGFRAVLWHQGESDANQRDPTRTLPGSLYREYLEQLIRESRRAIGWDAPWFVAQVSYHVPGDESSPDIRAAQASLWNDGIALEGPDSDALKGELREAGGKGVHFSGAGLRAHAAAWVEKVAPWVESQR
jgi:hypothetical protein